MPLVALVRTVSPSITQCELTHLARSPIDFARAEAQHAEYVEALQASGCTIAWLPPEPGLPDAVFVEDTAVVLDEMAVVARPGAASRRPEVPGVAKALERYRPLYRIEEPGTLDGGDVLVIGKQLFVGQTPRTNADGIAQLGRIAGAAGYDTRAVPVTGCLHLKSAVTSLDDRTVVLNPEWVDRQVFAAYTCIEVDPAEPFAANALRVSGVIIHPLEFGGTRSRLTAEGFAVFPVPAAELAKAEGGVTCCSLLVSPEQSGRL